MKINYSLLLLIAFTIILHHSVMAASSPSLSILTTISPTYQLIPNDTITYTIDFWNEGDSTVRDVVIHISLPDQFLRPMATSVQAGWVADANDPLTWRASSFAGGEHGQIVLEGIVSADVVTETMQLSATATIESIGQGIEQNSADNRHIAIAWLTSPLELSITPSNTNPEIGEQVIFSGTWKGQKTGCTQPDIHLPYTQGVVGEYSSIAIGRDGLPIISFHDSIEGSLLVTHCKDDACDSSTTTIVDQSDSFNEGTGRYTSIAIGRDDLPIISYYTAETDDLRVAHCQDAHCAAATITTLDQEGFVGTYTAIAIGTDGLPVVSYYDESNQSLKLANCLDLACTTAEIKTVLAGDRVGTHNALAIGRDGFPIISYYNASQTSLALLHCEDRSCSQSTTQTIDDSADVGLFTSIAIKEDGFPILSYYDDTNGDLNVASCSDFSCLDHDLQKVESHGDVGRYSSLAIGADGLPVISYFANDQDDLRLAHCQTANCSQVILSTLDTYQSVGQHNDLAIGNDGLPIISYHESGAGGNLRVAHCQPTSVGLIDYGDGTIEPISAKDETFSSQHTYNIVGNVHPIITAQSQEKVFPLQLLGELSDLGGLYGKAWHRPGTLRLGRERTLEAQEHTVDADQGDDGVQFQLDALDPNVPMTVTVVVTGTTNQTPTVAIWFDWNNNGQFDTTELAIDLSVTVGVNKLFLTIPADFVDHDSLIMRVRLYEFKSPFVLPSPTGLGFGGEVEDYVLSSPTAISLVSHEVKIAGKGDVVVMSLVICFSLLTFLTGLWHEFLINSQRC